MSGLTTTGLAARVAREAGRTSAHHVALFERILERIHGYFRRLITDSSEAEDCTQRTFLELERSLREAKYEAGRSFNTWMWMKAHKVFCAWCREREKGRRLRPLVGEEAPAPLAARPPDFRARAEEEMDARTVLGALRERLGAEAYECFVLRYEGGLTLEEIAQTVGRTRKTVAARITRAHALIDRLLGGGDGDGGPEPGLAAAREADDDAAAGGSGSGSGDDDRDGDGDAYREERHAPASDGDVSADDDEAGAAGEGRADDDGGRDAAPPPVEARGRP